MAGYNVLKKKDRSEFRQLIFSNDLCFICKKIKKGKPSFKIYYETHEFNVDYPLGLGDYIFNTPDLESEYYFHIECYENMKHKIKNNNISDYSFLKKITGINTILKNTEKHKKCLKDKKNENKIRYIKEIKNENETELSKY